MKTSNFFGLALLILFSITACNSKGPSSKNQTTDSTSIKKAAVTYTCPMHPEVVSNMQGKCPKCKMDLVEVKKKSDSNQQ